jgi:DNA anti-recombination protein RmuC
MGTQQEQKNEVEKLQDKFTKEFENLANKILEEKSNKFTEQNKENIRASCLLCRKDSFIRKKKSKIRTKKASTTMQLCANRF